MPKLKYTYYHNVEKDERGRSIALWRGYRHGDSLQEIQSGEIESIASGNPLVLCEDLFAMYNRGSGRELTFNGPSMSVGDVVVIDGHAYAVASFGFDPATLDPSKVVASV